MAMLEDLIELYPFSWPLHTSYAFALKKFKPEKYDSYLQKAALHIPDRKLLYKIIHQISDFENDENKHNTSEYQNNSFVHKPLSSPGDEIITANSVSDLDEDEVEPFNIEGSILESENLNPELISAVPNEQLEQTESSLQDEEDTEPFNIEGKILESENLSSEIVSEAPDRHFDQTEGSFPDEAENEPFNIEGTTLEKENLREHRSEEIPDDQWLNSQLQDTSIASNSEDEGPDNPNAPANDDDVAVSQAEKIDSIPQPDDNTFLDALIHEPAEISEQVNYDPGEGIHDDIAHTEISEITDFEKEGPAAADELNFQAGEGSKETDAYATKSGEGFSEAEIQSPHEDKPLNESGEDDSHTEISEISELQERSPVNTSADDTADVLEAENLTAQSTMTSEQAASDPVSTPAASQPFINTIETVIPDREALFYAEREEINGGTSGIAEEEVVGNHNEKIIENIASSDYFVFDQSAIDPLQKEEDLEQPEIVKQISASSTNEEVTKYDDDKMPFSFLWWLDKTRKQHANFQPYTSKAQPSGHPEKQASGQLNQQIIENIFHIQPEINVFQNHIETPISFGIKRKEDVIIEKFITEDPQIRPPKGDKLDTENKARKSSEDTLDMVSETLAKIYTDQMLFHKAIETYRKLSLKFPEKSTYFAGRIQDLEKKF